MNLIAVFAIAVFILLGTAGVVTITQHFVNMTEPLNYCPKCGKAATHSEWLPCEYKTSSGKPAVVERLVWCDDSARFENSFRPIPISSASHSDSDKAAWGNSHWNAIERKRA